MAAPSLVYERVPAAFLIDLMEDMDQTAVALCESISGARLAFVQSDEISVLMTDFATTQTEPCLTTTCRKSSHFPPPSPPERSISAAQLAGCV